MNAILKYPGAKNRIAEWIISFIPEHKVYVEPYAGSLAVLLNKPRCHIETVNDLDNDVVNFFKVLREHTEEFVRLIELTPYARQEYEQSYITLDTDTEVEKARKFCVKCWQGFGCGNNYHNGFKNGQRSNSPNPAKAFSKLPKTVREVAKRLQGVQIENLPALEILKRYDTEDVFAYIDPPYLPGTRKGYLYRHEMNIDGHEELLETIKKHPGRFLISGYDNDLYNDILIGWKKVQKDTTAEHGLKRTETLWMNYEIGQQSFMF